MSSKNNTEVILGGKVFTLSVMKVKNISRKLPPILIISLPNLTRTSPIAGSQQRSGQI